MMLSRKLIPSCIRVCGILVRSLQITAIAFSLLVSSGCVYSIARIDGPYEGRVVESDTGKPIEGAVVLGIWYKEIPTVAGSVSSYYDAVEVLTGKNGEFVIKGQGLQVLSDVGTMHFQIFKAGYRYESGIWEYIKDDFQLSKTVKWEGKKPVIPLYRMNIARRNLEDLPPVPPTQAPVERVKLYMEELNKERDERGLPPLRWEK